MEDKEKKLLCDIIEAITSIDFPLQGKRGIIVNHIPKLKIEVESLLSIN